MYSIFEKLMQNKGVSPYKVSKDTGVTQSTLSDWKRGRSTPKTDNMKKIADYFGVTVDYLVTGEETDIDKMSEIKSMEELDLAKRLEAVIGDINDKDTSPLYYKGEKIDDKSLAVLALTLENAMKQVEIMREKKKK